MSIYSPDFWQPYLLMTTTSRPPTLDPHAEAQAFVLAAGTIEARALMFLPSQAPPDMYSPEMKRGLQLYVKRVFVMDECKELMPTHFRFVKGVVDAHDLSLNVSREILQKDRQIGVIKKQLVKKVISTLDDMKRNALESYTTFWREFGPVMKEGLLGFEESDNEKLLDLVMAYSTKKDGNATDLTTMAGVVATITLVAAVACWVPAWLRSTRTAGSICRAPVW